jgi:hypothetical protein
VAFYELLTSSCLLNNMGLVYNATANTFANKPGVETRVRDFGGLTGVDWVDHTDDLFGWTLVCCRAQVARSNAAILTLFSSLSRSSAK